MPRGEPWLMLTLRVDKALRSRLVVMAAERDTSLSRLVRAVLRAECDRWETPARMRERAKNGADV